MEPPIHFNVIRATIAARLFSASSALAEIRPGDAVANIV